jgi:YesN/AraC family two-component response regulator
MEITVKNMVCPRCIASVSEIFQKESIAVRSVLLGKVTTENDVPEDKIDNIKEALLSAGFEWINDYKNALIEKVKSLVIDQIHHNKQSITSWSQYLSEQLNQDYRHISQLFSEIHGITLEQYILRQKIEKVKELIRYDQLTLSQIAHQLNYSSTAHLSSQFKKVTGMTPSTFKKSSENRTSLDLI